MTTATTRLLDAIRAAHGNCTDYRAGKLLGTTTATVSRWRTEVGHMSMANVSKACELARVPEQTWEWQIRIGAEREQGPDGDVYRDAKAGSGDRPLRVVHGFDAGIVRTVPLRISGSAAQSRRDLQRRDENGQMNATTGRIREPHRASAQ